MTLEKATDIQIQTFLDEHSCWSIKNDKLHREYVFADFVQAFGFMTAVAQVAERANHHPEWFNVYKKVVVDLITHEADGITERDFNLARRMEEIANQNGAKIY